MSRSRVFWFSTITLVAPVCQGNQRAAKSFASLRIHAGLRHVCVVQPEVRTRLTTWLMRLSASKLFRGADPCVVIWFLCWQLLPAWSNNDKRLHITIKAPVCMCSHAYLICISSVNVASRQCTNNENAGAQLYCTCCSKRSGSRRHVCLHD